jgi:hypothetical protein
MSSLSSRFRSETESKSGESMRMTSWRASSSCSERMISFADSPPSPFPYPGRNEGEAKASR